MWIPLTSKDEHGRATQDREYQDIQSILRGGEARQLLEQFSQHQIYVIDRDFETHELTYSKIMDARYAPLRSVEE
jgi:hypothetical protein